MKRAETILSWVSGLAVRAGFPLVGVTAVEPMDASPFQEWLTAGYGADMAFLHRHLPLRADLQALLPGARSVIIVALPYPGPLPGESERAVVAKYARGTDYHILLRDRLKQIWQEIQTRYPDETGRIFVDSGPLPERELARRAGIGWIGSNSCLIHYEYGSRLVIGEILTTLTLQPTPPTEGACGNCRACLDACPTGAIVSPGIIDARRCLSYRTIEQKGSIPPEFRPSIGTRLFGCDTCQDVCPCNRRVGEVTSPMQPAADLLAPDPARLLQMSMQAFKARFHDSALARSGRQGLLRNACIVLGNLGESEAIPVLRGALLDPDSIVRAHAVWALRQLGDDLFVEAALTDEADGAVRAELAMQR